MAAAAPDVERGFELLTDPGPDLQRVVLMLDHADALDPAALRYVQFAAHGAPLRLVFAGGRGLRALLEREEFGLLRRRFIGYAPAPPQAPASKAAAPAPTFVTLPTSGRTDQGFDAEAFPGGAEAALEFAAFEKRLIGGDGDWDRADRHNPDLHHPDWGLPIKWHAPISEPDRHSTRWLMAGAGMAIFAAAAFWLINSGLLASCFADMLRMTATR